ncbi:MAG: GumC family protein [Proteobacteria bacterium]|nr:GumC family protein [Pseudomonadota bacterium]
MVGINLRDGLAIAFKYRRRALSVLGGFVGLAVAVCVVMTPIYAATCSVLVKLGRELVYRPDVGVNNNVAAPPVIDKDEVIASNVAIMTSRDILERAITTVGIETLYPDLVDPPAWAVAISQSITAITDLFGIERQHQALIERALYKFNKRLKVEPVKKTNVIEVTFEHPDPQVAARVANLLVDYFKQKTLAVYSDPNLGFLERQVADDRAALLDAEAKLATYRQQSGVYQLNDQINMLLRQRIELDTSLKGLVSRVEELRGMVTSLKAQRKTVPATIALYSENERYKVLDDTQSQLLSLRLKERELESKFNDTFPLLVDVRSQIAITEKFLAQQQAALNARTRVGSNDVARELELENLRRETELTSLVARRDVMQEQIARIDGDIQDLSGRERAMLPLQREVDTRNDNLKQSLLKAEEARILDGLNREKSASFSVIQTAVPPDPTKPARPVPILYIPIAFVLGLIGAAFTAYLSYYSFDGFLTPDQAAHRLGVPTLGVIGVRAREPVLTLEHRGARVPS